MESEKPHSANLRKGRYSQPRAFYFLTTCVSQRRRLFHRESNALVVLESLQWLDAHGRFAVDAAVVMPDHVHIVGQLRRRPLSSVMHTFKSYSAHRLAGDGIASPVWQNGYHDHALRRDEDYRKKVTYVLQNPIRAGLTTRIEDYPYQVLPGWWTGELV